MTDHAYCWPRRMVIPVACEYLHQSEAKFRAASSRADGRLRQFVRNELGWRHMGLGSTA
jgi:hypothetical protein